MTGMREWAHTESPVAAAMAGDPSLLLGAYDIDSLGYSALEFVVSGTATSYTTTQPLAEASWGAVPADNARFATRIVVLRPKDPERFSGTVIVEWLNVTSGMDSPAVWLMAHRQLVRAGHAFVAVSAQKMGVEGGASILGPDNSLKRIHPERYGGLHHPGDAFSYDIYSQVGRLVRSPHPGGVLGDLVAQYVIAVGESQSAAFLTTYVNRVDPLVNLFDGFFIHSRLGGAARLDGELAIAAEEGFSSVRLWQESRVPVMTFVTESDVLGFGPMVGFHTARQPDTDFLRTWELAGAAHADNYTIAVSFIDTGLAPLQMLAAGYAPTRTVLGEPLPQAINCGPQHHYVAQAALDALDRWVRTGTAPASGARIELSATTPASIVRDEHGIARGGIRTPWVDVPIARLSGEGSPGSLIAALFGTSEVFDQATLKHLYPGGKADYLGRFEASLDRTIRQGFALSEDRREILDLASAMWHGIH